MGIGFEDGAAIADDAHRHACSEAAGNRLGDRVFAEIPARDVEAVGLPVDVADEDVRFVGVLGEVDLIGSCGGPRREPTGARSAINRVRSVHNTVVGVSAGGTLYSANDPGLLGYVHATLVDSALCAASVYGPRLSPGERDGYVAEMARVAELLGVNDPPCDAGAVNA